MQLSIPEPSDFLQASFWGVGLTVLLGAIALLGFIFKWGVRFRFVGFTGFMAVLTVGLFALGWVPIVRSAIPGAARFTTVFDSGSTNIVVRITPPISEETLTATLRQAASDYFSPGRLGRNNNTITIRARAVIHPETGVTQPLYLGQVRRSIQTTSDDEMEITLFPENLAQLPPVPVIPDPASAVSADPKV
jgi:hypothetical protein